MEKTQAVTTVNGVLSDQISTLDRGLAFGDGVFETLRMVQGRLPLLDLHCDRLFKGCQRLKIPFNRNDLERYLSAHVSQLSDEGLDASVCKVIVTRGVGSRGYQPDLNAVPSCVVSSFAFPCDVPLSAVDLHCCQQSISRSGPLAGIKHLNRLENVLLKQECIDAGFNDGLVFDDRGLLVESTSANVFLIKGEKLFTPRLNEAGIEGVTRRLIIEKLAEPLGLEVYQIDVQKPQLNDYEAAFLCNSVMGIVAIKSINDEHLALVKYSGSSVIELLQKEFERMFRAQ